MSDYLYENVVLSKNIFNKENNDFEKFENKFDNGNEDNIIGEIQYKKNEDYDIKNINKNDFINENINENNQNNGCNKIMDEIINNNNNKNNNNNNKDNKIDFIEDKNNLYNEK